MCAQDCEWIRIDPKPSSTVYYGIWGFDSSNYFLVGTGGYAVHYDGITWKTIPSFSTDTIKAVWGFSRTDVFGVSRQRILHYDGVSWSQFMYWASYELHDIWGIEPNNIYAVGGGIDSMHTWGDPGTIVHYNGITWSEKTISEYNLQSLWGFSSTDIFAVGTDFYYDDLSIDPYETVLGGVLHYDGLTWTIQEFGYGLTGIWGSSTTDVYAVGYYHFLSHHAWADYPIAMHYDGTTWSLMGLPSSDSYLFSVWGTSPNNVYATGGFYLKKGIIFHYDGTCWSQMLADTAAIFALWGNSDTDIIATGAEGKIYKIDCLEPVPFISTTVILFTMIILTSYISKMMIGST